MPHHASLCLIYFFTADINTKYITIQWIFGDVLPHDYNTKSTSSVSAASKPTLADKFSHNGNIWAGIPTPHLISGADSECLVFCVIMYHAVRMPNNFFYRVYIL